jgi:SAM-dependent methyltransferase
LLLARQGLDVIGVDTDLKMAEVARHHGLRVEVAPFESWQSHGRRFQLITCAQAWHWLDPAIAVPKAASLLTPAGALAVFWNYGELTPELEKLTKRVYEDVVPGWDGSVVAGFMKDGRQHVEELEGSGYFAVVGSHTYRWAQEYSVTEWVAMVQTHSNHLRLPPDTRAAVRRQLIDALSAAVGNGGRLTVEYGTFTVLARTAG